MTLDEYIAAMQVLEADMDDTISLMQANLRRIKETSIVLDKLMAESQVLDLEMEMAIKELDTLADQYGKIQLAKN